MSKTLKLWTSLGVAALSGTLAAEAATFGDLSKQQVASAKSHLYLADASGEGGEAGEAGASGGAEGDRTDYLMDLALVEGHMLVGVALYKAGDAEAAKPHMKHPRDELFADLKMHFEEMKVNGFGAELEAVAMAVETGAAAEDVDAKLNTLLAAIAEARGGPMEAHEAAQAAVLVLKTAADEFGESVKDGKVVEAHEYQDAWGFVQAAKRIIDRLPDEEKNEHMDELQSIGNELAAIEKFFPDTAGKMPVMATGSDFAAAAARIELTASGIK